MVDNKEKLEELFATWLAQNAPSARLTDLYLCYSEIEAYCFKTKVLRQPLFETTDLATVKKVQKTVTESRIFQLSHKKQMKKIVTAAQYYTAFVKALPVAGTTSTATDVSRNIPFSSFGGKTSETAQAHESGLSETSSSLKENVDVAVQERENMSVESAGRENKLKIDYLHIDNLAYTKPVSFAYFGAEQTDFSGWAQLYVKVIKCLSEDYPNEFLQMFDTNIGGGRRIDFGTKDASRQMRSPKRISEDFYAETNLSARDTAMKIRILLDRCNVDYCNLEIYYVKLPGQEQQTKATVADNVTFNSYEKLPEQKQQTKATVPNNVTFNSILNGEKYRPLSRKLKNNGIDTLEKLKEVNLWAFMNQHQLYPIQQRLAISAELTTKLRSVLKEDSSQDACAYEIHYNGAVYNGASPSEAFVAFLTTIAAKYPLKFRELLGAPHRETSKIVLSRNYDKAKLWMHNPDAYIDRNLSLEQVKLYISWVIERCGAVPTEYSVMECRENIEPPAENPPEVTEKSKEEAAPSPKAVSASDLFFTQKAENYLLQRDLTGATYEELQNELNYTMTGTKSIVAQSPHIIEMNRRLYHEDVLVDREEGADALETVLDKLLKKNKGITTAKNLYEYARSEMAMFFNDNNIADQQSVYDLARHLFEKLGYHGKHYVFRSNMYISRPEISADSVIDIAKKYAREKGTTVTFEEMESYLTGIGLNTGNLRGSMRIDKEPVFLIYAENEYLLAELMRIDDDYLKKIYSALRHLFADCDGHIIPRAISNSWYNLLPDLPSSLEWTPMLLQQMIRFYPDKLDARTIIAMETQGSNTLHAMFVEKGSWIQDFRDVVAVFLHEELPNRCEFEAEELRGILVNSGMLNGNELIYNMHNALGGDPRFIWDSDSTRVKVRI